MRTNVYIDGFNLFYGCLKDSPYRWLDVAKLCQAMLPVNTIQRIRYFTALVQPRPGHPNQQQHQLVYLRALRTIPNLSIHHGKFLSTVVTMPLAKPPSTGRWSVDVIKTEEKGSEVSMATHLLMDSFHGEFDVAVIVTNDSDLLEPINIVRKEFKRKVGVLSPHGNVSWALKQNSTFYKHIDVATLAASQFPATMTDAHGTITKPPGW